MKESASCRLEMAIIGGQRPLGIVETVTDLGGQSADLTISAATWKPGLFQALTEGATLDSFTSTTKNNGSGPVILSGIKASERKITVTYTGTLADEIDAADVLYFEGAWDGTTYTEMPGLLAQGSNLTGTSLGLSATTYMAWKGNTYDFGGAVSFDGLEQMLSVLRDRGASGSLSTYMPNNTFGELVSEMRQNRVIDSSYNPKKGKTGFSNIAYESPEFGEVELIAHPFMSWGEIYAQEDSAVARVGSSDLTFGIPGIDEDAPKFERIAGYTAAECILFTDQCVINKMPARAILGSGVTH